METKDNIQRFRDKGITLVALVVTILILLILAGITIASFKGDKGLLKETKNAKNEIGDLQNQTTDELQSIANELASAGGGELDPGIPKVEPEDVDDWEFFEKDGVITITGYKGKRTELVVPNSIGGVPVKHIAGNHKVGWLESNLKPSTTYSTLWHPDLCIEQKQAYDVNLIQETITKLTISEGIETIESSFIGSKALQEVILPSTLEKIKESLFYGCRNLTNVTIRNGVTSIGGKAFWGCGNLTSVTIPDSVASIGISTFQYCTKLTNIEIPNSVTSIGNNCFYSCSQLVVTLEKDSPLSVPEDKWGAKEVIQN